MDSRISKTLAIVLAIVLCVPTAACQSGGNTSTSAEGYRWENFDDGSDVLSLDVPYIPSNADSLDFNVILEKGKLADSLSVEDVTLGSALDGWNVDSAERRDDVTLEVKASRPDGLANNGASLASVALGAGTVVEVETAESSEQETDQSQAQAQSTDKNKMVTSDEVNEMKGVEWPEDAMIVNKDEEAVSIETKEVVADTPEEVASLLEKIEDCTIDSEEDLEAFAEENSANDDTESVDAVEDTGEAATPYEVYAVFANPALAVDFDKSDVSGKTYKATIEASDFALSTELTMDSFSLVGADSCSIDKVGGQSESEVEVQIALPQDDDVSALEGAQLVLKGDSNESEADVVCAIEVPEAWLDLQFDYTDTEAGTVTLIAELNNSKSELNKGNLSLNVDGTEVSPTSVTANDDGTYAVTLDAKSVSDGSAVTASVEGAQNVLGTAVEVAPCTALVDLDDGTRAITESDLDGLLSELGKKGLTSLASFGWETFFKKVLDPENRAGLYDVSNNEVLSNVVKVQQQLDDLTFIVNALNHNVLTGQKSTEINDARSLISRIKTEELQLCDQVKDIYNTADPVQREEKLRTFAGNTGQKVLIDNLATDLGVLYDKIMGADSSTDHDLITLYDELMALSYNWGAQTYASRQNFRTSLATVWTNGAEIVALAYGIQTKDFEASNGKTGWSWRSYLDTLDEQTKNVNTLINETHAIDMSVYRHGGDFGDLNEYGDYTDEQFDGLISGIINDETYDEDLAFDEQEADINEVNNIRAKVKALRDIGAGKDPLTLYCNTTGTWYKVLNGADTENKWDKGFQTFRWDKGFLNYNGYTSSPFGNYKNFDSLTNWDDSYMNTLQAKTLASRLHDGQTLKTELESVGFKTAKYFVTSERFDRKDNVAYTNNDWYFDTFEVDKANAKGEGFTKEKQHYDASDRYALVTYVKHFNWCTPASDMFVLNKVTI